jgi:predicted HTH transcriptional regulator
MKQEQREKIINFLRDKPNASKTEITNMTHISIYKVKAILAELKVEGLVNEYVTPSGFASYYQLT